MGHCVHAGFRVLCQSYKSITPNKSKVEGSLNKSFQSYQQHLHLTSINGRPEEILTPWGMAGRGKVLEGKVIHSERVED
jgi:hypothetical protein